MAYFFSDSIFQKSGGLTVYSAVKILSDQIMDGCNLNGGIFFLKKVV